ncbi:MAG: hypothetical protein NWF07_05100 [Candidatus Bathyarchaeota archaeon]|nr:hypothetical protein [Candidatus Bathyarchaeota archaeon]
MNIPYLEIWRLVNGLFTIGFLPYLYGIYKRTQRRFYLLWGVGFGLYGLSIVLRSIILLPTYYDNIVFVLLNYVLLYIPGFILIITGVGVLIDRANLLLISSLSMPILILIIYFTSSPESLGWVISLAPYLFMAVSLLIIRSKYSASLDLLVVGWASLLLTNIATPLELMTPVYVEVYAIFSKMIILIGMTSPQFSYLVDDLRNFLISGIPTTYLEDNLQTFTMLNAEGSVKDRDVQWIRDRIKKNTESGIRNIFLTTYDLISAHDLISKGISENEIYIVRMVPGGRDANIVFEQPILTINDNVSDLDMLFSDIINFSNERRIRCEIILYTFSSVIHTHGWKRVYSFVISKLPQLKNSMVHLTVFYYPETHSEEEISKFESMADQIISLVGRG